MTTTTKAARAALRRAERRGNAWGLATGEWVLLDPPDAGGLQKARTYPSRVAAGLAAWEAEWAEWWKVERQARAAARAAYEEAVAAAGLLP